MSPTYWFISFLWRDPYDTIWHPEEATTKGEHPIGYMARARKAKPERVFRLMFFNEIPEEMYLLLRNS